LPLEAGGRAGGRVGTPPGSSVAGTGPPSRRASGLSVIVSFVRSTYEQQWPMISGGGGGGRR